MDQTLGAAYSFGLDLGTHRSLMAVKAKGGTVEAIIPSNQECRKGIPSLFWRTSESDGGRELLCEQVALEQGEVNDPEGVVRSVKTRLLEQKPIVLHGRSYTPQDIAAKEVGHVYALSLSEAEERGIFETPKALTVGVPVRFGAAERTAIRSVLSKALPDMPIQLLPEPMAAAIYYAASARQKTRYTLAFDMGAGTFDVCVLESVENDPREPYPFRQLSHDGSREAGDLLDEKMEELILDKLRRDPGSIDMKSFSPGSYDLRALRKTAREAKEALSSAPQFTAIVTSLASPTAIRQHAASAAIPAHRTGFFFCTGSSARAIRSSPTSPMARKSFSSLIRRSPPLRGTCAAFRASGTGWTSPCFPSCHTGLR